MYQDRHWLWQVFPEIFPLPPKRSFEEAFTSIFCCKLCNKTFMIKQGEICQHFPIYKSLFDAATNTFKRGVTFPFPAREEPFTSVLDLGCGVGNTAFPLMEKNAQIQITSIDLSEKSIFLYQKRERFDPNCMTAICGDITQFQFQQQFDYAVLLFVLSSIPFDLVKKAVFNAVNYLNTGGTLLFFDYAEGDYRETKRLKRQDEHEETAYGRLFRRRGEDTQALFFNQSVKELFAQFGKVEEHLLHEKAETNRKTQEVWTKRYVLLKLRKL